MNIVVCVKQVPDTWAEKKLDPTDKTLDRASVDGVMNEIDEYAVEEALRLKEAHGGEVTILTMGPAKAVETIRKALSMGADKAVHLSDDALHGSCAVQTSYALAQALGTVEFDLVITGSEATDSRNSVMPALLAERLGLPQMSLAKKVEVDGTTLRVHRQTENGYDVLECSLPAVVSVVEKINEPRYPSFKGIMAAKSKPVDELKVADLGLDAAQVGAAGAGQEIIAVDDAPAREAGEIIVDEGEAFTKIVEFLDGLKVI